MHTNADMTIFNVYRDPKTKEDKYLRTYLKGVLWVGKDAINHEKVDIKTADNVKVFIPFSIDSQGKQYLKPSEWAKLSCRKKRNFWTLQTDNFIINGLVDYEYAGDIDEITELFDDCACITSVDTRDFGKEDLKHWEVGAE